MSNESLVRQTIDNETTDDTDSCDRDVRNGRNALS